MPPLFQILMKAARGQRVEHLIIEKQPYLVCGNLEAMLNDRDTDVLFILIVKRWVGDDFGWTTCVLEKITPFLYFTPVFLAWYVIVHSILSSFTGFQSKVTRDKSNVFEDFLDGFDRCVMGRGCLHVCYKKVFLYHMAALPQVITRMNAIFALPHYNFLEFARDNPFQIQINNQSTLPQLTAELTRLENQRILYVLSRRYTPADQIPMLDQILQMINAYMGDLDRYIQFHHHILQQAQAQQAQAPPPPPPPRLGPYDSVRRRGRGLAYKGKQHGFIRSKMSR